MASPPAALPQQLHVRAQPRQIPSPPLLPLRHGVHGLAAAAAPREPVRSGGQRQPDFCGRIGNHRQPTDRSPNGEPFQPPKTSADWFLVNAGEPTSAFGSNILLRAYPPPPLTSLPWKSALNRFLRRTTPSVASAGKPRRIGHVSLWRPRHPAARRHQPQTERAQCPRSFAR